MKTLAWLPSPALDRLANGAVIVLATAAKADVDDEEPVSSHLRERTADGSAEFEKSGIQDEDPAPAHVTISVLALLLERVAEIRAGDTWRNVASKLGQTKVVEYDRAGARVLQTTEVREETAALLQKLGVPLPPRFHAIEPAPAT